MSGLIINSNELIINQKRLPPQKSEEYRPFWEHERDKCIYGLTIDGVYLPGFLYWHLNYFKGNLDIKGAVGRPLGHMSLRDNEWLINGYIREAERVNVEEGKIKNGVLILGTRRAAKSFYEESFICYSATFFKGTENVVSSLSQADIKVLIDGINLCMRNLPPAFRRTKVENKPFLQFAYGKKDSNNENDIWSTIPIRNLDGGKNTEALAGLTPFSVVIDEIGKGPWLNCFSALKPGLGTPDGWRCSPLCFGTSGDMDLAGDAKKVFENPSMHNFLAVEIKDEHLSKKRGIFISGHYAHDFKKDPSTLTDYLGLDEATHPNLAKVDILVTNLERAEKEIDAERALAALDEDPTALLKATMYHPKNTQELFLTESGNEFPIELCRAQLKKLEENPIGIPVDLYLDLDGTVKHKFSKDKPIFDFPVKAVGYKKGVIVIYEFPIWDAPYGLYVGGQDPYKHSVSRYSDSVGVTYIYKRIHTITGEGYRDMMVAQYAGRPDDIATWYENTRLLLKFYNAISLCENDDYNFIQYMIGLNEAEQYLFHKPEFIKTLIPNSKSVREYGVNATEKLINYLIGNLKKYLTETIDVERDKQGNIIKSTLGVSRILDPMLLHELINYNSKEGNYDRVRAFGLAQTQALTMTHIGPVEDDKSPIYDSYLNKSKRRGPFSTHTRSPFSKIKTKWQ